MVAGGSTSVSSLKDWSKLGTRVPLTLILNCFLSRFCSSSTTLRSIAARPLLLLIVLATVFFDFFDVLCFDEEEDEDEDEDDDVGSDSFVCNPKKSSSESNCFSNDDED